MCSGTLVAKDTDCEAYVITSKDPILNGKNKTTNTVTTLTTNTSTVTLQKIGYTQKQEANIPESCPGKSGTLLVLILHVTFFNKHVIIFRMNIAGNEK